MFIFNNNHRNIYYQGRIIRILVRFRRGLSQLLAVVAPMDRQARTFVHSTYASCSDGRHISRICIARFHTTNLISLAFLSIGLEYCYEFATGETREICDDKLFTALPCRMNHRSQFSQPSTVKKKNEVRHYYISVFVLPLP